MVKSRIKVNGKIYTIATDKIYKTKRQARRALKQLFGYPRFKFRIKKLSDVKGGSRITFIKRGYVIYTRPN